MIPWSKADFGRAEKAAANRVIRSGWLTQGKETEKFEEELASYLGAKYVVLMCNGTCSLMAALIAHNIGPGDEVIVPSFTFIATVNSIIGVGAKPVLVDCDLKTWNLTPEEAQGHISKKTKAIMPVDIAGMPIDITGFRKLCRDYKLTLIEDCAEAMGAEHIKGKVGSFGHSSIFSFHWAKVITAIEGGGVVVNDKKIANYLRNIRNLGRSELYNPKKHGAHYPFSAYGLNFRTNDVFSAVGRVQLAKINRYLEHRKRLVNYYKDRLSNYFEFQAIPDYVKQHANMFFAILAPGNKRDKIMKSLFNANISSRITFPPTHLNRWHRKLLQASRLKNTEELGKRILSIPIGNKITISQVERVILALKKALK